MTTTAMFVNENAKQRVNYAKTSGPDPFFGRVAFNFEGVKGKGYVKGKALLFRFASTKLACFSPLPSREGFRALLSRAFHHLGLAARWTSRWRTSRPPRPKEVTPPYGQRPSGVRRSCVGPSLVDRSPRPALWSGPPAQAPEPGLIAAVFGFDHRDKLGCCRFLS
jgi:hypothetical protein